jgi:hypothetical protein
MIGHARSGHSRKALDGEFDSPPSPPLPRCLGLCILSMTSWFVRDGRLMSSCFANMPTAAHVISIIPSTMANRWDGLVHA